MIQLRNRHLLTWVNILCGKSDSSETWVSLALIFMLRFVWSLVLPCKINRQQHARICTEDYLQKSVSRWIAKSPEDDESNKQLNRSTNKHLWILTSLTWIAPSYRGIWYLNLSISKLVAHELCPFLCYTQGFLIRNHQK